jgi:hypothetical protein
MFRTRLKATEKQNLVEAGFAPGLIEAVVQEATSPTWTKFRRQRFLFEGLFILVFVALGGIAFWHGTANSLPAVSAVMFLVGAPLRSWLDVREAAINRDEPPGHGARRLVWLAQEVRAARTVNSLAAARLKGHADAVRGMQDPAAALNEIARRITPGDQARFKAGMRFNRISAAIAGLFLLLMFVLSLF